MAKRIDQYLTTYLSDSGDARYSRSQVANIVDSGAVLVNGKVVKRSAPVLIGDLIEITIRQGKAVDISPKEISFDVLIDRPRYAVINKPAGISVHAGAGNSVHTLVNGIMHRFNIDDDDQIRPGIVHRLDKDTSGVLLIAKDSVARGELAKLFAKREVQRRYLAVCLGSQREDHLVVENNILRDRKHRQRMMVSSSSDEGRYAKSEIFIRRRYRDSFLAEVELHTGRTHQIRVHMKYLNTPVLGDELYGNKRSVKMFHRQALHAYKLGFTDPFTGEYMLVRAPLPSDMLRLIHAQSKR